MKPIFRSTFMGGFHKKDVATFIAKQSAQFEKKIEDIQSRLDRSETALEEERESFAADREELEAFRAKKANESASFEELAKLSSTLSQISFVGIPIFSGPKPTSSSTT